MKVNLFIKLGTLPALLIIWSSCSHFADSNNNHRSLSSVEARQEFLADPFLEREFYRHFRNPRAEDHFRDLMRDHQDLFFANQAKIFAFDRALAEEIDPIETPLYEELWIGRHEKEHSDERLAFFLLKLEELASDPRSEDNDQATFLLESVFNELHDMSEVERLPFVDVSDIIQKMQTPQSMRTKRLGMADVTLPLASYTQEQFDWTSFHERNQDSLIEEAHKRLSQRHLESLYKSGGHSIKSRIFPTVQREGNIIGGEFPQGVWSLTYDDGPHSSITPQILDQLQHHNVKATFFWLAQRAHGQQQIINRAKRMGMELANHSYSHKNIPTINRNEQIREIIQSTNELERLYGQPVKFFRLPYGSGVHNQDVRRLIADRGMVHVFWNVDSLDWQDRNPQSVLQRVVGQMNSHGRGVILFHDIQRPTVETTRLLLEHVQRLRANGHNIQFKTLEEIVNMINNQPLPTGPRTIANLNVRRGPSTDYQACTVLPSGTPIRILSRHGSWVRIDVPNPTATVAQGLRSCSGQQYVSANFIVE